MLINTEAFSDQSESTLIRLLGGLLSTITFMASSFSFTWIFLSIARDTLEVSFYLQEPKLDAIIVDELIQQMVK